MLRNRREALGAFVSTATMAMLLFVPERAFASARMVGLESSRRHHFAGPVEPSDLGLEIGARFGTCVVTGKGGSEPGSAGSSRSNCSPEI